MPVRSRRRIAAAIALTAGLTAGACLLSACGPDDSVAANSGSPAAGSGSRSGAPTGSASEPAPGSTSTSASASASDRPGSGTGSAPGAGTTARPAASAAPLQNGTAGNGLTISDGTRYVVMNGTRVDFGTAVRDLSWSPDGKKAAFIDGDGDLAVARPDGTGRVVVARNPGNQNWSHPTWQVRPRNAQTQLPAISNLLFAVRTAAGVSRLYGVPSGSVHGTPRVLALQAEPGEHTPALPQTGNVWPSAGAQYGNAVYANTGDGKVYVRDDNLRQQGSALTTGSEPATSPYDNGGDIVFVRSVGGHDHLFVEHETNSGAVVQDLTPRATTDYTEPAWSSNGTLIAARTPAGIVTLPADGSHAPVKVSGYLGLPAFRHS
ncbi:WD40-like Beta Propeller Repeat [Streptomyces sp. DvalAA-14]|uniref:PD40 domain-containing protein n=1 Tax=unclassified Streptomyces TaxID=2593676 RepID=UPI00081B8E74|nr:MULTISPECIES: PD40 domain-containing protein [unclassified Streptomyces]MYS20151.1 hypothetical protein [Streptomyces sp. SID4948]SCD62081.1 WD40-like Beta Propeller Repeat [Streptomyces sp. DvalAA-14]